MEIIQLADKKIHFELLMTGSATSAALEIILKYGLKLLNVHKKSGKHMHAQIVVVVEKSI